MRGATKNKYLLIILLFVLTSAFAGQPDCTGLNSYPANIALTFLMNKQVVSKDEVDSSKTLVRRLASEQIDKDLYKQVHYIVFTKHSGGRVAVITINEASSTECSMDQGVVYEVIKISSPN